MNLMDISYRFSITAMPVGETIVAARLFVRFAITLVMSILLAEHALAAPRLDATIIEDSSVYGRNELFDVYKNHLGQDVTKETAVNIAGALQQKYLEDGFSRPGYRILDRGLGSGIVKISVVEASISRVEVSGDAGPWRQELEDLVGDLPQGQTLRPDQVREILRNARRLPGLTVDVATETDAERSGGIVLAFDSAYRPVEGSIKVSNRGTDEIGRNLLFARLVTNSLFGRENTSGLFFSTAEDSDNYSGGGIFTKAVLDDRETSAQLQAAATSLEFETQGVNVAQGRERYSLRFSRPLRRRADHELSISAGFGVEDLDVEYNGLAAREERLRSIEFGVSRTGRGHSTQSLASVELEQGLNGLGSRLDNFVNPDHPVEKDFTIARLRYTQLRRLNDAWVVRWDAFAHHSSDVLPSIKRFKVGGGRIGRGFEAAAVRGDIGIGNKLELRRRVANGVAGLERAEVYGFYDLGTAWRNDVGGRESAASAGLGIALRGSWLSGYLELARPLTHADADGRKDAGVFAELTARF